ncbi:YadA-like family protein [Proteus hauseri]|uniref:YadA-like family protein n=1 Tax=Proteus hauseri TaxID=183417 RepID=UPI0032DB2CBB
MIFKKLVLLPLLFSSIAYSNTTPIENTPLIEGVNLGNNSQASGNQSIAIGPNSKAQNNRSVAIGYNALATEENTVSFGNKEEKKTSRLVNVSEGKANTDAVNFAQTKAWIDKNKRITDHSISQLKRDFAHELKNANIADLNDYVKKRQDILSNSIATLDKKFIDLEKKVLAAIASSVAMSSIPYISHQQFSSGIGISNYRTGAAVAGGIQYIPNDNIAFRLNSSLNSEKEITIGGGIALGW